MSFLLKESVQRNILYQDNLQTSTTPNLPAILSPTADDYDEQAHS